MSVIIFPTDTVYGIGCPIFDLEGIERIYQIKHRSKDKPLACLCASLEQIKQIAIVDDNAITLIEKFLPGPLTIILKAKDEVFDRIGYKTIGIRIPNCKEALYLLEQYGPMLTSSVNESGSEAINSYNEIKRRYEQKVDAIMPPTAKSSSHASTVVSILDGKIVLLREGTITFEMINKVIHV